MYDVLRKIHWSPQLRIIPSVEASATESDMPWLPLSKIFEGLFLTCEETVSNRRFAQSSGISLILTLNGGDYVAPYRVYEYSSDMQRCVYTKLTSFSEFLTRLDRYTCQEIPDEVQFRKVFLRSVPAEDSPSYDISCHFPELCTLIELVMVNRKNMQNSSLALHAMAVNCLVGVSRSVTVVAAYIMKRSGCSKDEALIMVKNARPVANPNPGFHAHLLSWGNAGYYRVVDCLTALLAASELRHEGKLITYMEKYFPLILRLNKLGCDRQFFALAIAEAVLGEDDLRYALEKVYDHILYSVTDEVFADVPAFFANVSETIAGFFRFVPMFSTYTFRRMDYCFADALYYEICKSLAELGVRSHHPDIVGAFCSFFEAIGLKHVVKNSGGRPRIIDSVGKTIEASSEKLILSFPFLPFLAPFAAGFLPQKEVEFFGEENWTTQEVESKLSEVLSTFRENFLLTASGTEMSSDPFFNPGRWHAGSRLRFLEYDMEVKVMESVESGLTLLDAVSPYLKLNDWDSSVSLAWMRKLTGAVVGTRFFYDAVDSYFKLHYRNSAAVNAACLVANKFAPWEEIFGILQTASTLYVNKCGEESSDFLIWIREELGPLLSQGIVSIPAS
ncbi:putative phopshatase [Trypanosoma conorhini]|uniref:Putative phopshatase n=1 Tax=Trypanosoma conorhini TaxID=83891 RepID=A0A3R7L4A3_9TRYP|nr:putative phopshatase [Trypanosoma conorhini]RNF07295.1 putative phopshatase [Trypanosoma conorhini]